MYKLLFTLLLLPSLLLSEYIDYEKKVNEYTLKNGLKVYLISSDKIKNTKISVDVKMGTAIEDEKTAGISHLVEHLVFRDKRIPHNDYVDYIKENGGTDVNGYTSKYNVGYYTVIDSKKTSWIIKTFNQMLFDKQIDDKDLEIEKKALQTEIGDINWLDSFFHYTGKYLDHFPDSRDNFFNKNFNLSLEKERISEYLYQTNNKKFTLNDINKYYDKYYYPSNMTLKIVGNFNIHEIKNEIGNTFGKVQRTGKDTVIKPKENPKSNNKKYFEEKVVGFDPNATIGIKYVNDNYKENLILDIYYYHLADKLQQELRNKKGNTYGVISTSQYYRKAKINGIKLDALEENIDENVKFVKDYIKKHVENLDNKEIKKAIEKYDKYFESTEITTNRVYDNIQWYEYRTKNYKENLETYYQTFKSITNKEFIDTLNKYIINQNEYIKINKEYFIFKYDIFILYLIFILAYILVFMYIYKVDFKLKKISYIHRDIVFTRRLTNRITSFFMIVLVFLYIQGLVTQWFAYFFGIHLDYDLGGWFTGFVILSILLVTLFRFYYTKMELTKDTIYLIGFVVKQIKKDNIKHIEISSYSTNKISKIYGFSFLFFKNLVQLELNNNEKIYLRTSNAKHLVEDLEKWKNS